MAAGVLQAGDTVRTRSGVVGTLVSVATTNSPGALATLRTETGLTTVLKVLLEKVSADLAPGSIL